MSKPLKLPINLVIDTEEKLIYFATLVNNSIAMLKDSYPKADTASIVAFEDQANAKAIYDDLQQYVRNNGNLDIYDYLNFNGPPEKPSQPQSGKEESVCRKMIRAKR